MDIKTESPDMKMKNLIIKLHAPRSSANVDYSSTMCSVHSSKTGVQARLFDALLAASQSFIAKLDASASDNERDSELVFRISHVHATFPSVQIVDCRIMNQYQLRD